MPALLGLAIAFGSTTPAAATEGARFSLIYSPNPVCPDERTLLDEIARRAPRAERATTKPVQVEAWVTVDHADVSVHASVIVRRLEGTVHRELSGQTCEEVARAAAFIVALAIDPDDARSFGNVAVPEPSRPAARPPRTSPLLPSSPPPRSAWWLGGGVVAGLSTGVEPHPAPSIGLFLEGGQRSPSFFALRFRATALHAQASRESPAGTASFGWLILRAAACPFGFGPGRSVELCATFDFGRLRASGSKTMNAKEQDATWYGPGLAINVGVPVRRWLALGASMGALSPLARDRFYFRPDETVHRIPTIAGYGLVWLGMRS